MNIFLTYFLFMLPPLIFMIWAQFRVSSSYNRYSKVRNMSGLTGAQAAQTLLEHNGLGDVKLEGTKGKLTDHYDPGTRYLGYRPTWLRFPRWRRLVLPPTRWATPSSIRSATGR